MLIETLLSTSLITQPCTSNSSLKLALFLGKSTFKSVLLRALTFRKNPVNNKQKTKNIFFRIISPT